MHLRGGGKVGDQANCDCQCSFANQKMLSLLMTSFFCDLADGIYLVRSHHSTMFPHNAELELEAPAF